VASGTQDREPADPKEISRPQSVLTYQILRFRCGVFIADLLFAILQAANLPDVGGTPDCIGRVYLDRRTRFGGDESWEAHASNARKQTEEHFRVVIGGWCGFLVQERGSG
jgi:hypothetical protein